MTEQNIDWAKVGRTASKIYDSITYLCAALGPIVRDIAIFTKKHHRVLHLAGHGKRARTRKKNINRLKREYVLYLKRKQG